jgi:hypothetical protein
VAKGHEPRLIGQERDRVRETKKMFADAVNKHGAKWVAEIIKAGPYAEQVAGCTLQEMISRATLAADLFKWAMVYAGDRGGAPRLAVVEVSGAENLGPIEVRFSNFERPADT